VRDGWPEQRGEVVELVDDGDPPGAELADLTVEGAELVEEFVAVDLAAQTEVGDDPGFLAQGASPRGKRRAGGHVGILWCGGALASVGEDPMLSTGGDNQDPAVAGGATGARLVLP
jgi:hypothetical protein